MSSRKSRFASMRSLISASWRRSAASGVDAEAEQAPITVPDLDLRELRAAHPLARVIPVLEDVLGPAVNAGDALFAVGDANGQLLWISGSNAVRRRAERIGFVPGANWDERVVGTNAPGTALALDASVQVDGVEHFRESVRPWSCVAAPIHDPLTGQVLGVLDVTGGPGLIVPQTVAMVRATARMAEAELRAAAGPPLADASGVELHVQALGRDDARLSGPMLRSTLRLGIRHSEIVVLLAAHPDGLPGAELAELLYPDRTGQSTVRAELNRLRAALGEHVLGSRPYRLVPQVAGDWLAVEALLAAGDISGALRAHRGRLLPRSQAPGIQQMADELVWSLRRAVIDSGRPELIAAATAAPWGSDDVELWSALLERLPAGSSMRNVTQERLERLNAEFGLPDD